MRPDLLTILVLFSVLTAGCRDPLSDLGKPVTVRGAVTVDGEPLPQMMIVFNRLDKGAPAALRGFWAVTDDAGRYTVEQIYPATYAVTLSEADGTDDDDPAKPKPKRPKGLFKYSHSGNLRAKVEPDTKVLDFELTSR